MTKVALYVIPLPASTVEHIARVVAPFRFDRIHGGWWGREIASDASDAVARSAARYIDALGPGSRRNYL